MKAFILLFVIYLVFLLSGCAVDLPRADKDRESYAKTFSPKANLSNIYVYRPSEIIGTGTKWPVTVDGQLVGDIANGFFYSLEVPPGKHTISTYTPGTVAAVTVALDTEVGKNYYLWQDIDVGPVNKLHQVDEATGRREVAKYSMISIPDNVIKSIATATKRNQLAAEIRTDAPKVTKPTKAPTERLVLMPLRVSDEDKSLQGAMETALVQGLQQNYVVFSGEQVSQKAREIFMKESRNTAKKECDETRCMQGIAEAFQAELIATANVTKRDGGYFLALSIRNIFDNKVVYSNSVACKGCDTFQVVEKLKELSGI